MTQFNVYIPGTTNVCTFFLLLAHSSCCLHILLAHPCLYYYLLSPQYTVLNILFNCTFYPLFFSYFYFILTYIYIYSRVMFHFYFMFLHCPVSGPVLIYISLLIISCIIEYVTNKRTLNLELLWEQHLKQQWLSPLPCLKFMNRPTQKLGYQNYFWFSQ